MVATGGRFVKMLGFLLIIINTCPAVLVVDRVGRFGIVLLADQMDSFVMTTEFVSFPHTQNPKILETTKYTKNN